ncbi:MAG TPA: ankyrin repeat domain-containing protein [Puia sp.]|nr:ankyrin repeat domain-containing protein [Puia sp.]
MTDARTAFITAATWHGYLDEADSLLATHPGLAAADIHTAAITGNASAVKAFLAADPASADSISAPYGGTPLVYLCMSKYLRFDVERSPEFLDAAQALLDAGADACAGFWTAGDKPEFETALYGAAGVAHNAGLTRLLLAYGADPNDGEATYHSPEGYHNAAMEALVETGRLTPESLAVMLIRKLDWHDENAVEYLLAQGADPNFAWRGSHSILHHALDRSNGLVFFEFLLEYGADPTQVRQGISFASHAAREGRKDVLGLLEIRDQPLDFHGVDKLIAACAAGYADAVRKIAKDLPGSREELLSMGGDLLARFCLNGNEAGVRRLLELGVDANTPFVSGDIYFDIPKDSLAIHVAAWLGYPNIVKLLLANGSRVDTPDAKGRTPLSLAVKACVASYWMRRRTPESVQALLEAGASARGISLPTGYTEIDELLQAAAS